MQPLLLLIVLLLLLLLLMVVVMLRRYHMSQSPCLDYLMMVQCLLDNVAVDLVVVE